LDVIAIVYAPSNLKDQECATLNRICNILKVFLLWNNGKIKLTEKNIIRSLAHAYSLFSMLSIFMLTAPASNT